MTYTTAVLVRIANLLRGGLLPTLLLAGCCFSQTITVSPKNGPPTSHLTVGGTGFPANSAVDVYFDLTDMALAATDSTGAFSKVPIQAPSSALPGIHYVTGVARANQAAGQTSFNVRTDWAQFGFTPNNQRQNPYENVLNAYNVGGLDLSWTFSTDIPTLSSPALAGGSIFFGSYDGNLYALNATTGHKIWSYLTGSIVVSSPAVSQGNVYFGSYDGNVYALNAKNGAFVWAYSVGGAVTASPTVSNGMVYIATEGSLIALNAKTGALVWSYGVNAISQAAPAVANGAVFVTGFDGFFSINATTGGLIWFEPLIEMSSATAVAQGLVYADWGITTFGVSTVTGQARFIGNFASNSFALAGGSLYDGFNFGVQAWSTSTESLEWTFSTSQTVVSSPAVANGVVYVGCNDDSIYALDAFSGAYLWSFQTAANISTSPVVANGMLYVTSVDGNVYAFSLPNGPAKVERPNPAELSPNTNLKISQPRL
jgi:outer membrane protein assembly factor BamB